jgi:hypothetical protein
LTSSSSPDIGAFRLVVEAESYFSALPPSLIFIKQRRSTSRGWRFVAPPAIAGTDSL